MLNPRYHRQDPILWAAENGYKGVVKLLLEKGANIETKGNNGQNPLSWAAKNGHEGTVKLLLQRNVNIDNKDNDSWTPLPRNRLFFQNTESIEEPQCSSSFTFCLLWQHQSLQSSSLSL
jgi:ankyrin repeat protein